MWEFAQDSVTEQLKVDQALLNVSSTLYESLWLYQLSDECVAVTYYFCITEKKILIFLFNQCSSQFFFCLQCPYKKVRKIPARSYVVERINTATQLKWSLYNSNVGPYAFENRYKSSIFQSQFFFSITN